MQYSRLYTSPLLPAYMHLHSLVDPFRKNVKFYFILPCKKFGKWQPFHLLQYRSLMASASHLAAQQMANKYKEKPCE